MDTGLCCVIVKEVNASMLKKKLYLNLHRKDGVSAKSFEPFFRGVESNQNRVILKRMLCLRNNYAT